MQNTTDKFSQVQLCSQYVELQSSRGLEQVLVVVVHVVQVILHDGSLSDLSQQLVHDWVGDVVAQQVQNKAVSSTKLKILQSPCSHFAHQNGSGQIRDHDPGEPVDQAEDGDGDEGEPPEPEDEEILLVENVVVEDAEIVTPVDGSSGGTNPDVASYLSWEKFTHWIVAEVLSFWSNMLHRPDVVNNLLAVPEELVEQKGISHEHREKDHDNIQELTEAKVDMVLGISHTEVQEVLANHSRVTLASKNIPNESILQEVPPEGAGKLGKPKAECEEERDPEVVGSDGGILLRLNLGLVDKAAGSLALQVLPHIGCTVDPAVRSGILVPALADDSSPIQVVFQENEQKSEHDHEC